MKLLLIGLLFTAVSAGNVFGPFGASIAKAQHAPCNPKVEVCL